MEQVKHFETIAIGLKILLGFIGTLTLGIGGVGLMNIMLSPSPSARVKLASKKRWARDGATFFFSFWLRL